MKRPASSNLSLTEHDGDALPPMSSNEGVPVAAAGNDGGSADGQSDEMSQAVAAPCNNGGPAGGQSDGMSQETLPLPDDDAASDQMPASSPAATSSAPKPSVPLQQSGKKPGHNSKRLMPSLCLITWAPGTRNI